MLVYLQNFRTGWQPMCLRIIMHILRRLADSKLALLMVHANQCDLTVRPEWAE